MPRPRPRPLKNRFRAKPHRFGAEVESLLLGMLAHKPDNELTEAIMRRHREALKEAAKIVGMFAGAEAALLALPRGRGRPRERFRMEAISRLRQLFVRHYAGRDHGRVTREHEFIDLCLRDARLIPTRYSGLRFQMRDPRSYAVRAPVPHERLCALERIADGADKARKLKDTLDTWVQVPPSK